MALSSFAEGLRLFFTRGSLVSPVRINNKMRELLKKHINYDLSNTAVLFDDDDFGNYQFDLFMRSMTWLQSVAFNGKNKKPTRDIARTVHFWLSNKLEYDESDTANKLSQWVTNKINKYYANSELVE